MRLVGRNARPRNRKQFRFLPIGATYYVDFDLSGPNVKSGYRKKLNATTPPNSGASTAVADTSTLVRHIGKLVLGQRAP